LNPELVIFPRRSNWSLPETIKASYSKQIFSRIRTIPKVFRAISDGSGSEAEEPQVTPNKDIETEAEESDEEEEHEEDDDDNELFEIEIEDVTYCTNDEENGIIYELTEEGEAGKKVGFLKDGEATFY
jgi:hypothetical protein